MKVFANNKEWRIRGPEIIGNVAVDPIRIKFLDENGEPVLFDGKWSEKIYVDERMARPSDTARVIARRPVLDLPWTLKFELFINQTEFVTTARVRDWFVRGGISVGIGAYRPMFGRFEASFS